MSAGQGIPELSYEEVRRVVLDILAGRESQVTPPTQYGSLERGVAEVLVRRGKLQSPYCAPSLSMTISEAFWDLFSQGVITIGHDSMNQNYPFFRVSRLGRRVMENESVYFFHDVSSYEHLIKTKAPNVDEVTLLYLSEAMRSFFADCMLASAVMLGVAAENCLDLLISYAEKSIQHGTSFSGISKEKHISRRATKVRNKLQQLKADLPKELFEGLEVEFDATLNIIRTTRNESGHPTGKTLAREQMYISLQFFVSYCQRVFGLIEYFKTALSDKSHKAGGIDSGVGERRLHSHGA